MIQKEKVMISGHYGEYFNTGYNEAGLFSYLDRKGVYGTAYSCRESFFYHPPSRPYRIIHCSTVLNIERLARRWEEMEEMLKIPPKEMTKFYRTQYERSVIIEPAKFWWRVRMRQSFMTLFIRGINQYARDDKVKMPDCMTGYSYVREIMPANRLFLQGFNRPAGRTDFGAYGGVVGPFRGLDRVQMMKRLKK